VAPEVRVAEVRVVRLGNQVLLFKLLLVLQIQVAVVADLATLKTVR
jgi:hypothetical protein